MPLSVGFNIEMKVPFREEFEDMRLVEPDLNAYTDAVLKCVYDHGGNRDIIFSSFEPEVGGVCACLLAYVRVRVFRKERRRRGVV